MAPVTCSEAKTSALTNVGQRRPRSALQDQRFCFHTIPLSGLGSGHLVASNTGSAKMSATASIRPEISARSAPAPLARPEVCT